MPESTILPQIQSGHRYLAKSNNKHKVGNKFYLYWNICIFKMRDGEKERGKKRETERQRAITTMAKC